jgi:hypothetical protein
MVVGVACAADAGGSVESVDFEAGVVGDDDVAGGMAGIIDSLEAGVAFEGGLVFGGSGDVLQAGEWSEDDVIGPGGGEVAELAGVRRGYI